MPPCRLGPLAAALLLGLLPLRLPAVGNHTTPPTTPVPALEVKGGLCPNPKGEQNCTDDCYSDSDCEDNLKCCWAGCATRCLMPDEKVGSCPEINPGIPMLGLCYDECQTDSECWGQTKCCRNGCGKVSCVTPVF
ncbi:WAP four-disulfide core domain protein 2 [Dasypus novemcinctus]|uniref:WAP four-disulfide core domain protein 2 n=1 Tax=Dasypus novemcinctus TaxID=9361 RepID=UPI0026601EF5|nr:WAP four-disulfide core domain protein 2 [Dasypus novemcinctus]